MATVPRRDLFLAGAAAALGAATGLHATDRVDAQSAWESVEVESLGWTTIRDFVRVGMMIRNPNQVVALASIEIEVVGYDAGGTVLKTTSSYVEWLAPQQRLGVADSLLLSTGRNADRVEASIKRQAFRPMDALTVDGARFVEERFSSNATGTVRSSYPMALEDIKVSALYFDSGGTLIGGGETFLSSLPANGTAAARVSVPDGIRPARVEMYAYLSGITKFR